MVSFSPTVVKAEFLQAKQMLNKAQAEILEKSFQDGSVTNVYHAVRNMDVGCVKGIGTVRRMILGVLGIQTVGQLADLTYNSKARRRLRVHGRTHDLSTNGLSLIRHLARNADMFGKKMRDSYELGVVTRAKEGRPFDMDDLKRHVDNGASGWSSGETLAISSRLGLKTLPASGFYYHAGDHVEIEENGKPYGGIVLRVDNDACAPARMHVLCLDGERQDNRDDVSGRSFRVVESVTGPITLRSRGLNALDQ